MAETKAEAFARLSEANMWDKFQKRTGALLKTYPDLDPDDLFQRVLKEYPPEGTVPEDAFSKEELEQLDYKKSQMSKQRSRMRVDGAPKQNSASVMEAQKAGFTKQQLAEIHQLPKGTPAEGVEFAIANLYNPSLEPSDFPCVLAYTYWMLGRDDPKTLQAQALKLLDVGQDETDTIVIEDSKAQYAILARLEEFHGIERNDT